MFEAQVAKHVQQTVAAMQVPVLVQGTVASIVTVPFNGITIKLQGASNATGPYRYPAWYSPTVGDSVYCHKIGTDVTMLYHLA